MGKGLAGKWVFDSNLLVYALDETSPFYRQTRELFSDILKLKLEGVVAQQNILEAEHVLISKLGQREKEVVTAIENLLAGFRFGIIGPLSNTWKTYHLLVERSMSGVDLFDHYLAATLIDNKVPRLLTLNAKDFKHIYGLEVINPLVSP